MNITFPWTSISVACKNIETFKRNKIWKWKTAPYFSSLLHMYIHYIRMASEYDLIFSPFKTSLSLSLSVSQFTLFLTELSFSLSSFLHCTLSLSILIYFFIAYTLSLSLSPFFHPIVRSLSLSTTFIIPSLSNRTLLS